MKLAKFQQQQRFIVAYRHWWNHENDPAAKCLDDYGFLAPGYCQSARNAGEASGCEVSGNLWVEVERTWARLDA